MKLHDTRYSVSSLSTELFHPQPYLLQFCLKSVNFLVVPCIFGQCWRDLIFYLQKQKGLTISQEHTKLPGKINEHASKERVWCCPPGIYMQLLLPYWEPFHNRLGHEALKQSEKHSIHAHKCTYPQSVVWRSEGLRLGVWPFSSTRKCILFLKSHKYDSKLANWIVKKSCDNIERFPLDEKKQYREISFG